MDLIVPEVGWLAGNMANCGLHATLALLGVAVTLENGNASDDEINGWYDALAASDDTVWDLNQYYMGLEDAHPYLSGFLGALTGWTESPLPTHYRNLSAAARTLRRVCWSQFESVPLTYAPALFNGSYAPDLFGASGDILGSVYSQMMSIGARRTKVFEFTPVPIALMEIMERGHSPNGGAFMDAWCGSGTRAIAWLRLCDMLEVPHSSVVLNDPNAVHIAMAGLNMIGCGARGKVALHRNREWSEMWAAGTTTLESRSSLVRRTLPPELAEDTPLKREELWR